MFVEIPRLTAAVRKCGPDQVTITKRTFTRGGEGLSIAVGARVMKRLGWKADQNVKILWGTDTDLGRLKMTPIDEDAPGWRFSPNKHKTVFKAVTSRMPDNWSRAGYNATVVDFEILEELARQPGRNGTPSTHNVLLIYLPRDFYARGPVMGKAA